MSQWACSHLPLKLDSNFPKIYDNCSFLWLKCWHIINLGFLSKACCPGLYLPQKYPWKFIFIFGNYTIQGFEILWLCINCLSSLCVSMYQKHDFKLEWTTCWEKWDNPGSENLISLVTWDSPCSLLTGWLMRSHVHKVILRQDFPITLFCSI